MNTGENRILNPEADEISIIKQVLGGDADAFEHIVKKYEKKVYNLALRYLKNRDDALDLSQEVFIQVYNNLAQFRGDSQFSTWIYRVTYNKCVDMLRKTQKLRRNVVMSTDDENFFETRDRRASIEEDYEGRETLVTVMKIIDTLPSEQRDVVILRYIKDLSYSQIADVLELAEGTVKSRLNRARLKIKEQLKESGTNVNALSS
ncbi:MAG: sigma-70 family RNA polymerase sigma factor [Clostridia bacterium]|nr:sigma-70 family RNA polymerase sigma factor [Clostridia bacterium]